MTIKYGLRTFSKHLQNVIQSKFLSLWIGRQSPIEALFFLKMPAYKNNLFYLKCLLIHTHESLVVSMGCFWKVHKERIICSKSFPLHQPVLDPHRSFLSPLFSLYLVGRTQQNYRRSNDSNIVLKSDLHPSLWLHEKEWMVQNYVFWPSSLAASSKKW